VRAARVGGALVSGGVLIGVEQAVLRIEVVQLARIAALAGLAVGIATVVNRRAVMLVMEIDVAAEGVCVAERTVAVDGFRRPAGCLGCSAAADRPT
jgi:hypothetical protein